MNAFGSSRQTSTTGAEVAKHRKTFAHFSLGYQYKPTTLYLGASQDVEGVRWSFWGARRATGTGTYPYNDCVPDCARGTVTRHPADLTASGVEFCGKRKRHVYKRLLIHFADGFHADLSAKSFCFGG